MRIKLILIEISLLVSMGTFVHSIVANSTGNQKKNSRPRPWEKFFNQKSSLKISYPDVKTVKLSNDIEIVYLEDSLLPKSYFKIIVEGGSIEEPQEKIGLTSLWGDSIVYSGSSKYTQKILSEKLDDHASHFSFSNNSEFCSFNFTALSNFFEEDLKIILQVINNPRFQPKDVELLRKQKIQGRKKIKENPSSLASIATNLVYWGSHLRGRISTEKTISAIQYKDIQSWQNKMWNRFRVKILVAGDININRMKEILEKNLIHDDDSSKKLNINFDSLLEVEQNILKDKINFIHHVHKDIPQSVIVWRAQGIPHHSKEYFALKIFDFILGGDSFNSFLTEDIRARRGWAYSVYSGYLSDKYGGYISLVAQTRNENVSELLNRVEEILKEPKIFITQEKIEKAKISIRNKFVFLYRTPFDLLNNLMLLKRHGLKKDYLSNFLDNIDKVTLDDALKIGKKYYAPQHFLKVIVAPENLKLKDKIKTLQIPE